MKKCCIWGTPILALVFSLGSALADPVITLSIAPASQTVFVGSITSVDISISGLGELSPVSLSAFDLNLMFDPTILAFNNASFGDPVLGDQLDLFGFGSLFDSEAVSGVVNLFELSFDLPDDLDSYQAGAFTLATVSFGTIGTGTSLLSLDINALGDARGDPLLYVQVEDGSSITGVVPEPTAFILLGTGLGIIGLRFLSQRIKHQ
jgi:hypothetical protein